MSNPLTDAVIIPVARLVDDAQSETHEPSHSDIEFLFQRPQITAGEPKAQAQLVGKAKRLWGTLNWALDSNPSADESLVEIIISLVLSAVAAFGLPRRTSLVQRP